MHCIGFGVQFLLNSPPGWHAGSSKSKLSKYGDCCTVSLWPGIVLFNKKVNALNAFSTSSALWSPYVSIVLPLSRPHPRPIVHLPSLTNLFSIHNYPFNISPSSRVFCLRYTKITRESQVMRYRPFLLWCVCIWLTNYFHTSRYQVSLEKNFHISWTFGLMFCLFHFVRERPMSQNRALTVDGLNLFTQAYQLSCVETVSRIRHDSASAIWSSTMQNTWISSSSDLPEFLSLNSRILLAKQLQERMHLHKCEPRTHVCYVPCWWNRSVRLIRLPTPTGSVLFALIESPSKFPTIAACSAPCRLDALAFSQHCWINAALISLEYGMPILPRLNRYVICRVYATLEDYQGKYYQILFGDLTS